MLECTDGSSRLRSVSNQFSGIVEVCVNNQWYSVCDDFDWELLDAVVACRSSGYAGGT